MEKSLNGMMLIGIVLIVLLTAGITYYVAKSIVQPPANQTGPGTEPSITVRGEASTTLAPDLLNLGITVETSANSSSEAQSLNARQTELLKTALLASGVRASGIETTSYYTYPVYNESCYRCTPPYYGYADAIPVASGGAYESDIGVASPDMYPYRCGDPAACGIIGYKTTHSITVKSDKTNDSGKFIEASLDVANTSIDYIYFSLREETRIRVESELQAQAALNARTKAGSIAQGLGVGLGKLLSVTTDGYYPYYPLYAYQKDSYSSSEGAAMPPTEVFPTDMAMSSSIVAVYELVPMRLI